MLACLKHLLCLQFGVTNMVFLLNNYSLHIGALPQGEWDFLKGLMYLMCPLMAPNTDTCVIPPNQFTLQ